MDFGLIRSLIASLSTDHDADGVHRPLVGEVFAPEQHASTLAPSTLIVVGARGAGKSFWAGVLGQQDTRDLAAEVYPQLGLEHLLVGYGYNGFDGDNGSMSRQTIDARVPDPTNHEQAVFFWQTVILRAAYFALEDPRSDEPISRLMATYSDPEDLSVELRKLDRAFADKGKTFLVVFDALDTLSREWKRLTALTDALFEAVWSLRARRAIRAKIFIRPDQLNDEGLKFVELPKIKSGRVELQWSRSDLYGLLYSRLAYHERAKGQSDFSKLSSEANANIPINPVDLLRDWPLVRDEDAQKRVMERLSGLYMGRGKNKGATYPWAFNHLSDGKGVVTPRSFLKLFVEAAKSGDQTAGQAINAEGIRHGLREASKIRVEQLALEYQWIKRALAPLAGLKVPCYREEMHSAWEQSETVGVILKAAKKDQFLPPFASRTRDDPEQSLEVALERIGVLYYRPDGRVDMPDLYRIAARMFKLGGVALKSKN